MTVDAEGWQIGCATEMPGRKIALGRNSALVSTIRTENQHTAEEAPDRNRTVRKDSTQGRHCTAAGKAAVVAERSPQAEEAAVRKDTDRDRHLEVPALAAHSSSEVEYSRDLRLVEARDWDDSLLHSRLAAAVVVADYSTRYWRRLHHRIHPRHLSSRLVDWAKYNRGHHRYHPTDRHPRNMDVWAWRTRDFALPVVLGVIFAASCTWSDPCLSKVAPVVPHLLAEPLRQQATLLPAAGAPPWPPSCNRYHPAFAEAFVASVKAGKWCHHLLGALDRRLKALARILVPKILVDCSWFDVSLAILLLPSPSFPLHHQYQKILHQIHSKHSTVAWLAMIPAAANAPETTRLLRQ